MHYSFSVCACDSDSGLLKFACSLTQMQDDAPCTIGEVSAFELNAVYLVYV